MCSAIAQALRMRPKSTPLSGGYTGRPAAAAIASLLLSSEPLMFGSPLTVSGRALVMLCSCNVGSPRPGRVSASLVPNVLVDVHVVLARAAPRIVAAHPVHHQLAEFPRIVVPQPESATQRRLNAPVIGMFEHKTVSFVRRSMGIITIKYRVGQAAHRSHH